MPPTTKLLKLTPQQHKFCECFLEHGNKDRAAREAGYYRKNPGAGSAVYNQPKVRAYLKQRGEQVFQQEHGTVDELIARAWRIVRFDPRKLADADGNYLPLHQLPDEVVAGLRGLEDELSFRRSADGETDPVHTRKYKFADPLAAITLLARIAKLLQPENHTTNIFVDIDKRLDAAQARLERKREKVVVSDQTGEKQMVAIPDGR